MSLPSVRSDRTAVAAAVIGGVALLGVIALTIALAAGAFTTDSTTEVSQVSEVNRRSGFDPAAIYAAANPAVVDITASGTTTQTGPFGLPRTEETTDTGTGFVVDGKGDILTADHVVAGARSVTVTLQSGHTRRAKILGGDPATDVAVLHIDPSGLTLHPLPLGSLSGHRIGDPVAVIGDPFDVQRSLSTGVISGLDRTIQAPNGFSIAHAIQTDAAMNPGNSGGPILDAGGHVIGIADQIATGNGGGDSSTGVGFAVPVDIVKSELAELEAGKVAGHAYLGISVADTRNGEAVVEVAPAGAPAAEAGVRRGDVVVALGNTKISGANDLIAATAAQTPGSRTTIVVVRAGKRLSLPITLGRQPGAASSS
jgi:S1-C subfamily serine protease